MKEIVLIGFVIFLLFCLMRLSFVRRFDNKFWWTLNRVRSCIAYEDDPGPWNQRLKID